MNLKELMAAALKAAKDIAEKAVQEKRALTDAEQAEVNAKLAEFDALKAQDEAQRATQARFDAFAKMDMSSVSVDDEKPAKSLTEHLLKHIKPADLARLKERGNHTISAPEFKAATDPNTIGAGFGAVLTDVDRTIVRGFRRPTVADLLGSGSISGNAITYYTEGAWEGTIATVAEGGQKPQVHVVNPTPVTDALKKIAFWFDTSDEMVEDLAFFVSEINSRGLYMLSLAEENQLLNGPGTGSTVLGLLNRSGIQTEAQAASNDSAADAIFRAMTKVQTATGLQADGIIINPADYQALRLAKDANNQYYGGGFFSGTYGNGSLDWQPPIWGMPTVVSAAVAAKTVVVGALKVAATVYRKGGVRVESTNSDAGKFTTNVVTTRIEERVALACRMPTAVVKVTLQ